MYESGKGKQDGHHSVMTSDAIKLWEGEETSSYFATFSFSQIRNATDKFSTENMLGEGGFGPVYKVPYVLQSLCFTYLSAFHKLDKNAGTEACGYVCMAVPYLFFLKGWQ